MKKHVFSKEPGPEIASRPSVTVLATNTEVDTPILDGQEQEEVDMARDNPKLRSMIRNIDSMVERTQKARKDLDFMMQTSIDLKNQCKIQEEECQTLDTEQRRVIDEMMVTKKRVDILAKEKAVLEAKLQQLKFENDDLEAFLATELVQ